MKRFILLAVLIGLAAVVFAQTPTKSVPKETTTHRVESKAHKTLGWKCKKHGTVCQLDVEDVLAGETEETHKTCDPATAIYLNVDRGQSILLVKRDSKTSDFTVTINPDDRDKDKRAVKESPYLFANAQPTRPVASWWTGPAMGVSRACYHLRVTTSEGEKGDPHIMFCAGALCN